MKRSSTTLLVVLALAACDRSLPPDVVATAGEHRLTVDRTVAFLVDETEIPAERDFIAQLADLWIDYMLLAEVAASDSSLGALDMSWVIAPQVDRELVQALSAQAIDVDTALASDELRRLYDEELPGAQVRASHILLTFDHQRAESRDSAVAFATELRRRAQEGERFDALARTYSRDPGSASTGGDLGFFDRSTMVPEFAQAAFALEPGQISEPVLTDYGVHVIRVTDRQVLPFDSIRDAYANAVKNRRVGEAVQAFVGGLEASANLQVQEGVAESVRELARDAARPLPGREAQSVLVRFEGGALTLGDLQQFFVSQPRPLRAEAAESPDEGIDVLLERFARSQLLVVEARRRGIEVSQARRDTLVLDARVQLVDAASALGLRGVGAEEGGATDELLLSAVDSSLSRIVRGEGQFVDLARLSLTLRTPAGARLNDAGVDRALEVLREERRARAPASATTGEAGVAPPTLTPADSSGPGGTP